MQSFHEEQRFDRILALIPVSSITLLCVILLKTGDFENYEIYILITTGVLISALFSFVKLETQIDRNGVHYQMKPFHWSRKTIGWDTIEKIEVIQYKPVREYGGYGLRYSYKNGKAFNIWGNKGIKMILHDGKKILIGTQIPDRASETIKAFMSSWKK